MIYIQVQLVIILCACSSIDKRPEPEIKKVVFAIQNNGTRVFSSYDYARSNNFSEKIKKIKRISIHYTTGQSDSKSTISQSIWQSAIEKKLLRKGFIVSAHVDKTEIIDGISIDLSEKKSTQVDTSQATLVIETVHIQKVDNTYTYSLDTNKQAKNTYTYSYYIAEISGKLVLHTNDIIWRSNITATTFDYIKKQHKKEPGIIIRALRDHSYSTKQDAWVPGNWLVDSSTDNFQKHYAHANSKYHKRQLIEYAVSRFINSIQTIPGDSK